MANIKYLNSTCVENNGIIITKDELYKFYIEENHSREDIQKEYSLSINKVCALLKFFEIKKDPKLISNVRKKNLLQKYGVENISQIGNVKTKKIETAQKRYGVDNISQVENVKNKKSQTFQDHYGVDCYFQTEEFKEHTKKYNQERYGVEYYSQSSECKEKVSATNFERYGVEWTCQRKEAKIYSSNNSKPNLNFEQKLQENKIQYEREFPIDGKSYDFKVGNILIEINPTATHNTIWTPFGEDHKAWITKDYHLTKTELAAKNGYRCIHVWDWDNVDGILELLKERQIIYARKCVVKEISMQDSVDFISQHHIQGYAKDKIRLGLFLEDELVSVMTFAKPRYNTNYEYELIRYCSDCDVIGGAQKMFSYFIKKYSPQSIISYCDRSKFSGTTYKNLGFSTLRVSSPTLHWFSLKTKQHFTDNLIRKQGFSRIVHHCEPNEDKGCSSSNNYQLMIEEGFLPVYDCGQATYIWKNDK